MDEMDWAGLGGSVILNPNRSWAFIFSAMISQSTHAWVRDNSAFSRSQYTFS
jgi:hypothetical protein